MIFSIKTVNLLHKTTIIDESTFSTTLIFYPIY